MRRPARLLPLLAVAALALPTAAGARVRQAEDVLPPGQSGFVSIPGLATGTGSPHLTDQAGLFTSFGYKSELFDQPGEAETPRAGVRIVRDAYGVPAVTGDSDFDAWWGVGYAVAQDRLFQLELFRRATAGRLAEILGPGYLEMDIQSRRDYYTDAEIEAQLDRLPAQLRARFDAYRDGMNAWVRQTRLDPTKVPGEFPALGIAPTEFSTIDMGRIGVFLARTVPSGDGNELENARALAAIGPASFDRLSPIRNAGRRPTVPAREGRFPSQPGRTRAEERAAFARTQEFLAGVPLPPEEAPDAAERAKLQIGRPGGSFMWAIGTRRERRATGDRRRAGERRRRGGRRGPSFTGKRAAGAARPTYLYNGPQLGYSIPELFVEFELHSPVQDVRGVSAAGVPVVGIGHNGHVAWGFTSGLSDEDDLYVEELTGPETYRFRGAERQMDCRDETFTWRTPPTDLPDLVTDPQQPAGRRTERFCRTVHGPVQERADGVAFARSYAIFGREVETIVGLTALNDARTIADVDRAMDQVTWNENVIAADGRGNIGYWHPGLHPLRPEGYDERLPLPGTGEAEWGGFLPPDRRPQVVNPARGWLAQWNNVPSIGWTNGDAPARERLAARLHRVGIIERLVRRVAKDPSHARSKAIVRTSGTTAQQRPLFQKGLERARAAASGRAAGVLDALLRWDGSYHRTDSNGTVDPGVAIFEQFKTEAERIILPGLGGEAARPLAGSTSTSHEFDITNGESLALRSLKPAELAQAADAAGAALERRFGTSDIARWRDPRLLYDFEVQGAASPPENFPFFDRGTWEHAVELGP